MLNPGDSLSGVHTIGIGGHWIWKAAENISVAQHFACLVANTVIIRCQSQEPTSVFEQMPSGESENIVSWLN